MILFTLQTQIYTFNHVQHTHCTRISCQQPKVVKMSSVTPSNSFYFIQTIQWPDYRSFVCWCFIFFFCSFSLFFFFFVPLNDFWVGGSTFVPFSSNIRFIQCPFVSIYRTSCRTFCSCLEAMLKTLCSL